MKDIALKVCLVVFFGLLIGGLGYLDWLAFREKFPDAAWWAWFFSHR